MSIGSTPFRFSSPFAAICRGICLRKAKFARGSATHPWWVWLGGLMGGFYVVAAAVTAPHLGAATLIALVMAGQSLASLLVDHFGWVGFDQHQLSAGRLGGMALVAAGVVLVRIF